MTTIDYNGNSIRENPFLKHDGAKRLFRRKPIILKTSEPIKGDTEFNMKESDLNQLSANSDYEYGPGIVEKLRARFSKLSDVKQRSSSVNAAPTIHTNNNNNNKVFYSSCDNLIDENSFERKEHDQLSRKCSNSVSDIKETNSGNISNNTSAQNVDISEIPSISKLRQRFENKVETQVQMRFARDPVKLISSVFPDQPERLQQHYSKARNNSVARENNSQFKKTSNVLKVLNDGHDDSQQNCEPEFIRIARRLRRCPPDVYENAVTKQEPTVIDNSSDYKPHSSISENWFKKNADLPAMSEKARIIRDDLPIDPHSARSSHQPAPSIPNERSQPFIESSPPPEEPQPSKKPSEAPPNPPNHPPPSTSDDFTSSVFKYDSTWKSSSSSFSNTSHASETILSPKATILPMNDHKPNVVSITVKGPTMTTTTSSTSMASTIGRRYSSYDKSDEDEKSSRSASQSTVYPPSYTPVSLSTKYAEEKAKSPQNEGDDMLQSSVNYKSISESDNMQKCFSHHEKDESDEEVNSSSSDDECRTGFYDVTPFRPNSLMFTRFSNEMEYSGDGNAIIRSLISLVAEEDLAEFLVALQEKTVSYTVVEDGDKPSTSSILKTKTGRKEQPSKRIQFCSKSPMAYAYVDEINACKSSEWDDGEIVEYSYFKDLRAQELRDEVYLPDDIYLASEDEHENENVSSLGPDPSFTESLLESVIKKSY